MNKFITKVFTKVATSVNTNICTVTRSFIYVYIFFVLFCFFALILPEFDPLDGREGSAVGCVHCLQGWYSGQSPGEVVLSVNRTGHLFN